MRLWDFEWWGVEIQDQKVRFLLHVKKVYCLDFFPPKPWRNNQCDEKHEDLSIWIWQNLSQAMVIFTSFRGQKLRCWLPADFFFPAQSIGLKVCPRIRIDLRSQYFPDFCSMVLEKMLRRFVGGVSWNISTVRITVTCMEFQSTTFSQAFGGRSGCSLVSSLCATMPRLFGPCFCGARSGRSIGKWVQ